MILSLATSNHVFFQFLGNAFNGLQFSSVEGLIAAQACDHYSGTWILFPAARFERSSACAVKSLPSKLERPLNLAQMRATPQ